MDRLLKTTTPSSAELQYQYDENGNLTIFSTPTASDHKFTFNRVNKTTAYTSALGSATSYEYDCLENLNKVTYGSETINYSYDGSLLTAISMSEMAV